MYNDVITFNDLDAIELDDQKDAIFTAAKIYIKSGIYVVPLRPDSKILPETHMNVNYGSASRKPKIIEGWFDPDNGRFAGWNIGIACGRADGVFAVDLDISQKINGLKVWKELEEKNFEVNAPVQQTPSGGLHMLFKWQENAVSSTSKIGLGIDTRGGEFNKCKSHIVAYPSIVNGKRYKWVKGGDIGPIPEFVMSNMGSAWSQPQIQLDGGRSIPSMLPRGSEMVKEEDMEKVVSLDQIKNMISNIDPDVVSYDDWLRIGQAIHSQHVKEGLEIWDEWSKSGSRYQSGECTVRWRGFNPGGSVRMGTLFYHAKLGGWEAEDDETKPSKFDLQVEKLNQNYAVMIIGGKIRILRERQQDRFETHEPHYDLLDRDAFLGLMENQQMIVTDSKGAPKYQSVAKIWLGHQNRRQYVNGMALLPNTNRPGYYNTWKGFAYDAIPGSCNLLLNHIRDNLCAGDEEHFVWLLDWLADLIQEPEDPKGCAVVLKGREGTGKGIFANAICKLFGYHSVHLVDESHLTGKFNAHMADAVFVFADEVTWGGNKKSAGKLKGMVTERTVLVERKGVDAIPNRNVAHFVIASNESWVVPAGAYSRRWFVLEVDPQRANDRNYFTSILHQLQNGGYEGLLHFLQNRTITSNLNKAPETEELSNQRAQSAASDPCVVWWSLVLDRGTLHPNADEWLSRVDRKEVYNIFQTWAQEYRVNMIPLNTVFYKRMREFGTHEIRSKTEQDGKRPRLFVFDDLDIMREEFRAITGMNLGDGD